MFKIDDAWNFYKDTKEIKQDSLRKEINRYNKHLYPYWKDIPLESIKSKDILMYKKYLSTQNLSPQSIKLCLSLLRRIINRSIKLEMCSLKLPYFEMPKVDNSRVRFLSLEEAHELLLQLKIKSELWHDITLFALNTGLRASEIFSIKPSAVNITQRTVTVFDTKNSYSRTIPLNDIALNIAHKYLSLNYIYLFSNRKITTVSSIFRNAVKNSNLNLNISDNREKIVFHSLRHTFASWLVQSGIDIFIVGNLLGHRSLQMTMRYAHLAPEQGRNAVNVLMNIMK